MPVRLHPPFSFRQRRKENGPCTVQKKRRCGGSGHVHMALHAAGEGWLAGPLSKVRDGNAGALSHGSWGCKSGIAPASLSAILAAPAAVVGDSTSTAVAASLHSPLWVGHGAMICLIATSLFVDKNIKCGMVPCGSLETKTVRPSPAWKQKSLVQMLSFSITEWNGTMKSIISEICRSFFSETGDTAAMRHPLPPK